jgi:hypothetical protein
MPTAKKKKGKKKSGSSERGYSSGATPPTPAPQEESKIEKEFAKVEVADTDALEPDGPEMLECARCEKDQRACQFTFA